MFLDETLSYGLPAAGAEQESDLLTWTMPNRLKLNEMTWKERVERLQIVSQCFFTIHCLLVMILMNGKILCTCYIGDNTEMWYQDK